MGNTASVGASVAGALDSYVSELGEGVVYDKSLGYTRLLKSVKAKHANGPIVVKFFIKPDPSVSLRAYYKRLKVERDALLDIANVHSHQAFAETEKAGYLVRQWLANSLYDRISIRPFLTPIEKKWISFQILQGLKDARTRGVSHGDIKSSNVLVTSWNWVYVTDFATTYKPTYLPLNDPADFSFYFDTSGRRTCYVAPERFYDASQRERDRDGQKRKDQPALESMDVFSVGCVLIELWLDGETVFSLSTMFKYRSGENVIEPFLERISDPGIRDLLRSMTTLDPQSRPTFDALLQSSRGTRFPESFYSFLHNYISSVNELTSPSPFTRPSEEQPRHSNLLPSDSDRRLERLWSEFDSVESYLFLLNNDNESEDAVSKQPVIEYGRHGLNGIPYQDVIPVVLHLANREPQVHGSSAIHNDIDSRRKAADGSPALIYLSLVLGNLRNASLPSAKLHGMDLLLALSVHVMDQTRLDRVLPHLIDMLHDDEPIVRMAAARTVIQLMTQTSTLNPSDALIWPEYILPNLRHLALDPASSVRIVYAQLLAAVAETSVKFLEMSQALKMQSTSKNPRTDYDLQGREGSYQSHLADIQSAIQEQLSILLADSASCVKRAVLHNVSSLCIFLGRQKTNELLLSHMITYLNDRDWQLRYAFFESVVDVAACLGGKSVEQFILPLLYQALSDSEESVVAKVLGSLRTLAELGLFPRMRAWELMSATLALLYHPNIWIRQASAAFIVSATKHLPSSDTWAILYPSLKHYLQSDISDMKDNQILTTLKPQVPRQVFDAAITWASRADASSFWRTRTRARSPESPRDALASQRKAGGAVTSKSEEDELQLQKLKQLGMTESDELKLGSMREYILKHASAITSSSSRVKSENDGEALSTTSMLELQKLGVVPRTVFLGPRPGEHKGKALKLSDVVTPRSTGSRRASFSSVSPRVPLSEKDGGQLTDDLRRQLSAMGPSSGRPRSVATPLLPEHSSPSPSLHTISEPPHDALMIPGKEPKLVPVQTPVISRPSSSMSSRTLIRPPHALGEIQKALPAIASIKENASGTLEQSINLRPRAPTITISSGRSSPVSNVGTVRAEQNMLRSLAQAAAPQGLLDNLIHQHDLSFDASQDFGPIVRNTPLKRRNNVRQTFTRRHQNEPRDGCQLIATLGGHTARITGIAVAPDHCFFVSSSSDKTVKVWDAARLERNITSKPRQVYGQHKSRITALCMLEKLHCFASAAENGTVHVVRVPVTQTSSSPKYGKLQPVRDHRLTRPGEYATCLAHYATESASNLVYATSHGNLTILELGRNEVKRSMSQPPHLGPIASMCIDPNRTWLVTGTFNGTLCLWDIRFGILVRSWKVAMPGGQITQCAVDPTRGKGTWIMVAVNGCSAEFPNSQTFSIEVWDIEKPQLVETFTSEPENDSSARPENQTSPHPFTSCSATVNFKGGAAEAIAVLLQSRQKSKANADEQSMILESPFLHPEHEPPVFSHAISCFLAGVNFYGPGYIAGTEGLEIYIGADDFAMPSVTQDTGFLLTGSRDCRIRFWDLAQVERSRIICGTDIEDEKPSFRTTSIHDSTKVYAETWSPHHREKRIPPRSNMLASHQQELLKAHQDTIVAIACIQYPFRGGIITGDASGVLKVWRVETT